MVSKMKNGFARARVCALLAFGAGLALCTTTGPARAEDDRDQIDDDTESVPRCEDRLAGPINLPADDSVHSFSEYSDEWYYYSSHLITDEGREFGFAQIVYTLLDPGSGLPVQFVDSTVTDLRANAYHFGGRQYSLDAPTVVPSGFDFQIGSERVRGGGGHDVVHSVVDDGHATYVVDLELDSVKMPVVHLADGYVNYYSRERMRATGTISVDGKVHRVHGSTWFDHQFGPQKIELSTVQNWTWIAAQLTQGRELLALVVNRQDGTQLMIGSYTDENCNTTQLGTGDFTVAALGSWAPSASCVYPSGWKVGVPSKGLDLEVQPVVANQDIVVPGQDHYYEGDSRVRGSARGRAYVELFGFCAP
jgi:hypothetical protein